MRERNYTAAQLRRGVDLWYRDADEDHPGETEAIDKIVPGTYKDALLALANALDEIEALRAAGEQMREALSDALSGWRYIRTAHGDLYGVGWSRVEEKTREALAAAERVGLKGGKG